MIKRLLFYLLFFIPIFKINAQCSCNGSSLYPTATTTSNNTGLSQTISSLIYAKDTSILTGFTTNKTYKFNSSKSTDVLTLRQTYPNGLVCDANPITYTFTTGGNYTLLTHTNTACGTESISRYTYITCLDCVSAPANDNCSGAISITPTSGSTCTGVSRSPAGATESMPGCLGIADDDTWFSFVATQTNHSINLSSVTFDMVTEVFSGSCGSLTQIVCSDPDITSLTGLTIGDTYYFRCYSKADGLRGTFNLCVTAPPPPPKSWVGGTGDWGVAANWSPSGVPTCSDSINITTGTITLNGASAECKGFNISSGTLNLNSGTFTIGVCGATDGGSRYLSQSGGTINLSGATVTLNGGFTQTAGTFTFSDGTFTIDPNGTTGICSSTNSCNIAGTFNMSGGNLILPDASSSAGNVIYYNNATYRNFTGGTVSIGGGSSTNQMNMNTWVGSGRLAFYNLEVNTFTNNTYLTSIIVLEF